MEMNKKRCCDCIFNKTAYGNPEACSICMMVINPGWFACHNYFDMNMIKTQSWV